MNRLLIIALLALLPLRGSAQAVNPQDTFPTAVNVNNPSLWLNFNDATTSFTDSVSGATFSGNGTAINHPAASLTGNQPTGMVNCNGTTLSPGTLGGVYVQFHSAPAANQPLVIAIGTLSGTSIRLTSNFTINVAATTALQFITTGVPATTITPGQVICFYATTGIGAGYVVGSGITGDYYLNSASLPVGANTYTYVASTSNGLGAVVAISSPGTARQPGFDNTNNSNFSGEFAYNQWNVSPNPALGAGMEWDTPWTMMLHINKLNWDHSSHLLLASKGDLNGAGINNVWWQLFIQNNSGNADASQLCFYRQSPAPYNQTGSGAAFVSGGEWCTVTIADAMPNSFNYDVIVEDNGTGATNAVNIWINGVAQAITQYNQSAQGFGGVTMAVTAGGSGYTSAPSVSVSGGGTNCTATATATITSGAVTAVNVSSSHGCTSTPTVNLTGGAGTGASITATTYAQTMNSPVQPLFVPGYVNNGIFYGPGGTDTLENPLYVDEFAIFPGNLSSQHIANIFYQTKFYQGLIYPGLAANPPLVIYGGYGCGPDFSGDQTIAMVIGAAKAGLIRLIGFVDDDGEPNGSNSVGWYRQMLDQAGLADVPVSIGANSPNPNLGGCPAANITAYNANTDQNPADYESALTMYRTLFAEYPTTPIYVLMTQTANGYNSFQLSPADGISSLTGLQLQQRNYNNGGWVNAFEGNFATTPPYYLALLNNMGSNPIYFEGGSPINGGPGVYASRTSLDPLYQAAVATTEDTVNGWTNQNLSQILSPYFLGGELISASGGTGYAGTTPFTSVGGGPYCNVTGLMVSSSGVPSSFQTSWYVATGSTYDGIGFGCTPAVFTATGSGTNLTVSAITCCEVANAPPVITLGDTISGTGIPAGTTIVSQTSGTPGGVGVYVTSAATTASAATVTRTPTIVLTNPTGAGVTLTVSNGIFLKTYEGSATASYAVWPNRWGYSQVFTWFQNSLIDPPTTGAPRPY